MHLPRSGLAFFVLSIGGMLHAGATALDPASIAKIPFVGDVQISADGKRIAYVVTHADLKKDGYQSDIWLIDGESAPRLLVGGAKDDARPRWSPDGSRLAFISDRAEKRQIHILDMRGGEAWPLTSEKAGAGAFAWSPDGKRIAYLARPAPANDGEEPKGAGKARITERLYYRVDGAPGFLPEQRSQLWVVDVSPEHGAPLGPLWDGRTEPSEPAWTTDGEALLFSALPDPNPPVAPVNSELFRVRVAAGSQAVALTVRDGPDNGPVAVARDGRVAWTGFDDTVPRRSSTTTRLYAAPLGAGGLGAIANVTAGFDRNVGETSMSDVPPPTGGPGARARFDASGRTLYFIAADRGLAQLYRIAARGGEPQSISAQLRGDLREFSIASGGRIAAVFGSATEPYEVWTADRPGGKWTRRTSHGHDAFAGTTLLPYEELWVESFDGTRIQAWLLKPPGFDPARRHPLLLYIHGGPHAMYGEGFFHEFQMLAHAGLMVLIANPRGSTGYGEEFANSVQYRYPGDDYRDLMAVLDAVIARGHVDTARLGVGGGSGGGVLTSWTIAQTDRFAAALVERPVVDFASHTVVADLSSMFAQRWFHDLPWRSPQEYFERSPINFVDRVKTPVLVIQSEQDYRTPPDQGIGYYNALRMLDKPARLVLFPNSSHGLSRNGPPSQRIERLGIIRDWFTERLLPPPAARHSAGD
ncbi:MAG TPA: S9 family peptidase [Steroidobacteraceae bacterium]|nr:S9 family peptidase [Steroidobacteraceae bacterium]HNS26957.1 S9 family peptidase [Steroidobacteraceae bacterium]